MIYIINNNDDSHKIDRMHLILLTRNNNLYL
jgi:hypothetical protein